MADQRPARTFTMTNEHVMLLCHAYVRWEDCESGAPAIDCKRPYGNSSVASDVAEILGWDVDRDDGLTDDQRSRADAIHAETELALQIVLSTGEFRPGTYARPDEYNYRKWALVPTEETV